MDKKEIEKQFHVLIEMVKENEKLLQITDAKEKHRLFQVLREMLNKKDVKS